MASFESDRRKKKPNRCDQVCRRILSDAAASLPPSSLTAITTNNNKLTLMRKCRSVILFSVYDWELIRRRKKNDRLLSGEKKKQTNKQFFLVVLAGLIYACLLYTVIGLAKLSPTPVRRAMGAIVAGHGTGWNKSTVQSKWGHSSVLFFLKGHYVKRIVMCTMFMR